MPKSKKIWNGFDSKPHTLPEACVVCSGGVSGEFVELTCGHGSIGQMPLHVACVVESFGPSKPDAQAAACCPLCHGEVGQDTLSLLADYVQRNAVVAFPDGDDVARRDSVCETLFDRDRLMQIIVDAQERSPSGDRLIPSENELTDEHYNSLLQESEALAEQVEEGVEERLYTREELDDKFSEIDALNQRIVISAGRAAQFEHAGWARQPSFEDIHDRLTVAQYRLQEVESRARYEYEHEKPLKRVS